MNVKLKAEVVICLKDIMKDCGIEDTEDNRNNMVDSIMSVGIVQFVSSVGIVQAFKEAFKKSTPERLILTKEEKEATVTELETPLVCPKCGIRPIYLDSLNVWVCNCRKWDSSPQPETICSNCKSHVIPFHWYWKCNCNRYDRAPKFLSSFPK